VAIVYGNHLYAFELEEGIDHVDRMRDATKQRHHIDLENALELLADV